MHKFNLRFNTKKSLNFSRRDTKHVQKTGMKCLREHSKSQKWDHANYIFYNPPIVPLHLQIDQIFII